MPTDDKPLPSAFDIPQDVIDELEAQSNPIEADTPQDVLDELEAQLRDASLTKPKLCPKCGGRLLSPCHMATSDYSPAYVSSCTTEELMEMAEGAGLLEGKPFGGHNGDLLVQDHVKNIMDEEDQKFKESLKGVVKKDSE